MRFSSSIFHSSRRRGICAVVFSIAIIIQLVSRSRDILSLSNNIRPLTNATNVIVRPFPSVDHDDVVILFNNETLLYENTLSTISTYSIIIDLHGEMGNHLSRIAYGYGLHWMLQEDYNVSTKLLYRNTPDRHGDYPRRWSQRRGMVSLQKCFPYFRDRVTYANNFALAESNVYITRETQQTEWLGEYRNQELRTNEHKDCQDETCIRTKLRAFIKAIEEKQQRSHDHNNITVAKRNHSNVHDDKTISLPFFFASTYASLGYINDRYYERLKLLFQFDHQSSECCSAKEEVTTTVFHVRGFLHELPRGGRRFGYEELSPYKTAHNLFNNTTESITLVGRFINSTLPYVTALQQNGFHAVIHGNNEDGATTTTTTGEQTFCYLLSVPHEIVGIAMSSFFIWAAYLGNATRARLYSVQSPAREVQFPNRTYFFHYNFTLNSWLQQKMVFELYSSEEQDNTTKAVEKE